MILGYSSRSTAMNPTFQQALDRFVQQAQRLIDERMAVECPNIPSYLLTIEPGLRYCRVVKTAWGGTGQRSIHCFVDSTNGDILKAASWKSPAKGPRGSIYE